MSRSLVLALILLPVACAPLARAAEKKPEAPQQPPALVVYDVPVGFGREVCMLERGPKGELVYHRGEFFTAMSCPQYFQALQEIVATYAKPGATRADSCWTLDPCSRPAPEPQTGKAEPKK